LVVAASWAACCRCRACQSKRLAPHQWKDYRDTSTPP
jgi:hypothetical protein